MIFTKKVGTLQGGSESYLLKFYDFKLWQEWKKNLMELGGGGRRG